MLSITFENVMTDVFKSMVILALPSALFSTFGGMLLIHPRLLQENSNAHYPVGCFHFILSLAVLSVGGYVANRVHRYQGLFAGFNDKVSRFRYYKMMYYGGIGFAAYGCLVIIIIIIYVAVQCHMLRSLLWTVFQGNDCIPRCKRDRSVLVSQGDDDAAARPR
jgi:hypothetical protein